MRLRVNRNRSESRSRDELREHFDIERELADRLRNAPSTQARRSLYAEVYSERSSRIPHHPLVRRAADGAQRRRAAAPQVRLLLTFLDARSRFCEVGAGDGAVALGVAPSVGAAIALDVTDELALPDDLASGFEFRRFDGFHLGLTDLDVVYSNDVAEHLHPEDFADHSRAVLDALKPGGLYICVTPNRLSGPHDISMHFTDAPEGFHLREYTLTELAAALRDAGFRRVRAVASVHGRRFGPPIAIAVVRPIERLIGVLPRASRRRVAVGLGALKVVAEK
jgi:SAM-dependent methyltransferase